METKERWRIVPGFPGYWVSDRGRVGGPRGWVLRPWNWRYLRVVVMRDGRQVTAYVHALVAAAFVGPRPEGAVINHRNGDRHDNRPSNLEYVTQVENVRHYWANLQAVA